MKVKKLIAKLEKCEAEAEVWLVESDGGIGHFKVVSRKKKVYLDGSVI